MIQIIEFRIARIIETILGGANMKNRLKTYGITCLVTIFINILLWKVLDINAAKLIPIIFVMAAAMMVIIISVLYAGKRTSTRR
jgi:hypothetical protein